MVIKNIDSIQARMMQVMLLATTFIGAAMAALSVGFFVREYDKPAYELAQFTRLAIELGKNEKNISFSPDVDKAKLKQSAALIEYGMHYGTAICIVTLVFTIHLMVVTVIEHKKTLIVTSSVGSLLAIALLGCAIIFFVAKGRAPEMAAIVLKDGMTKYSLAPDQHLDEKQAKIISGFYRVVDRIQMLGQCCAYDEKYGIDVYIKEFRAQKPRSCVPGYGFQLVPYSCCKTVFKGDGQVVPNCVFPESLAKYSDDLCNSTKIIDNDNLESYNDTKKCKDTLDEYVGTLGYVGAFLVGHVVFVIIAVIVCTFLIFEMADEKPPGLPPIHDLKKLGLGDTTIQALKSNSTMFYCY